MENIYIKSEVTIPFWDELVTSQIIEYVKKLTYETII